MYNTNETAQAQGFVAPILVVEIMPHKKCLFAADTKVCHKTSGTEQMDPFVLVLGS